jgi:DNA adenine methylase
VGEVIDHLFRFEELHSEPHYYQIRDRFNRGPDDSGVHADEYAAMFIYLNKTCFNGLYRVNRKGAFNVPFGRYKNPRIVDQDGLLAASAALQHVDLDVCTYTLPVYRTGDFVYLDPPYVPVSLTASFTAYTQGGFSEADQVRLRDVFTDLDWHGCKVMLSNSDTPFVRDLYRDWQIEVVQAARAINCNAEGRGKVGELVVRNYTC